MSHADPVIVDRVYYQRYSSVPFEPCPADFRYRTTYSCVAGDNSESWARLYSANADGSDEQPIEIDCTGTNAHWLAPWSQLTKVVVDDAHRKLYWENGFEPAIARTNLDGSDCEFVANRGYYGKVSLAIDDAGNYLYSVQYSTLRRVDVATGTVTALTFSGLDSFTPSSYSDITVSGNKLYATLSNVASAGHILEVTLDTSSSVQAARLLVTGQAAG